METVTSPDGTSIAFERFGEGQPVIMVGGALCDRVTTRPLAEYLARHATVFNYDRRGRGNSTDTVPYAIEREIEDLGALLAAAGGEASVYGHSSGAGLVLHAAVTGLPMSRFVLHEPPFPADDTQRRTSREQVHTTRTLLAQDRRADVLRLFLAGTGMPPDLAEQMSRDPGAQAIAHTLLYDFAIVGVPPTDDRMARVGIPALVLCGGASPAWMVDVGMRTASGLPNGEHRVLEGQGHVAAPEILVPVLAEFFAAP